MSEQDAVQVVGDALPAIQVRDGLCECGEFVTNAPSRRRRHIAEVHILPALKAAARRAPLDLGDGVVVAREESGITQWICSSRCWSEGGPHDETCREVPYYRRLSEASDE